MDKVIARIAVVIALVFNPIFALKAAAYDPFASACRVAAGSSTCVEAQKSSGNPILSTIHTIANLVALGAGIAAVIILILAGLTLVTSQGNTEAATKARRRITYTVVGLVILAIAWSLVTFVIDKVVQ